MPDTFNSRSPSVEGSLWAVGTESQGRDWRHLPTITSELSGAPRCHTVPCAGSTALQEPGEPQGPPASPSCPEEALAATWEQPWASEVFGPERMPPSGAARSFQEVTEPAVVAVDRQAIFPDTWDSHGGTWPTAGEAKARAREAGKQLPCLSYHGAARCKDDREGKCGQANPGT
uniref:cDNA: FLJ23042 fis, clone LNG02323 n=1 Tax=Homo sapiens TaxID=9606 RepID=Q9H5U1_HUMAN|nr:unnamed protein product [Homo sapiens]